tara:strand:+ start:524 stop:637 length:114 start_codon:yes stop_codon:yes gene_type:complete
MIVTKEELIRFQKLMGFDKPVVIKKKKTKKKAKKSAK